MELHYKGQTFERTARPVSYRTPYMINWRYQVSGVGGDTHVPAMQYREPRAVNWRFRASLEN